LKQIENDTIQRIADDQAEIEKAETPKATLDAVQ
jgi:hypothetical protein